MADNMLVKDGAGSTVTLASDDISSIQYVRHKLAWGADGAANDTSTAAPLPITLATQLDPTNDAVRVGHVVNRLWDYSGVSLTVKRARTTITTSSATTVVPFVTSKQIQVLGYSLQAQNSTASNFNFQDSTGTVVLSRVWQLDKTGASGINGYSCIPTSLGCGVDPTTSGASLMGKQDTTGSVGVEVTYVEV